MDAPDRQSHTAISGTKAYLAASLILIDHGQKSEPKFLLGRRHDNHVFLPGKFVFPGGRSEPEDAAMKAANGLAAEVANRLASPIIGDAIANSDALALTAIRELFEETGFLFGERATYRIEAPPGTSWDAFNTAQIVPDLAKLHYIARALTPPGFPRRFDTHFFAASLDDIAATREGHIHAEAELVELRWVTLSELASLDILPVTHFIAQELALRLAAGLGHDRPVPYFYVQDNRWIRAEF
jgi:8-oxo-dGTP pyrophosphatase MutT (NUDIX family)